MCNANLTINKLLTSDNNSSISNKIIASKNQKFTLKIELSHFGSNLFPVVTIAESASE